MREEARTVRVALGSALVALVMLSACASATPDPAPAATPAARVEPSGAAADWCAGHGLPESMCTQCNPVLVAGFQASGDWCAEHGFPESACPTCSPQTPPTGRALADWCVEHALPESQCTKCNPALVDNYRASGDWCAEHGFPESVCPSCNPVAPPLGVETEAFAAGTRIRFRSPEIEHAAGIAMEQVRSARLQTDVECTVRIVFDRNRLADVRASVPGIVREVKIDLGQTVDEGDELFVLESAAIGDLQGKLRAAREHVDVARANYQRQLELGQSKIASTRQVELARQELETEEAELRAIQAGLRITGAVDSELQGRYRERSPIAGTVIRRPATIGTFATNEVSLATIADTSFMWAWLEVREADVEAVRVGQPVTVIVDALPRHEFSGSVTWISSEVDTQTRTVAARAQVANSNNLLRAGQFAHATIRVGESGSALVVPREAIQRLGQDSVVFLRTGEGVYEPRLVSLGRSDRERIEVQGALHAGDAVVTDGAFLLKTELSRESIGAGCCEVGPPGGS